VVPRSKVKFTHQFPVGEVNLQEAVYGAICDALDQNHLTFGQLQNHPKTTGISLNNLYQAVIILLGIGYIHPAVDEQTYQQRKKFTDAFNNAVKTKAINSEEYNYLASPWVGTGVPVNRVEQLFLLAKANQRNGAEFVWQVICRQGKKMIQDGKTLETAEENLAYLNILYEEFSQERLLTLQKLGIE
jgi:hypothetical protein